MTLLSTLNRPSSSAESASQDNSHQDRSTTSAAAEPTTNENFYQVQQPTLGYLLREGLKQTWLVEQEMEQGQQEQPLVQGEDFMAIFEQAMVLGNIHMNDLEPGPQRARPTAVETTGGRR